MTQEMIRDMNDITRDDFKDEVNNHLNMTQNIQDKEQVMKTAEAGDPILLDCFRQGNYDLIGQIESSDSYTKIKI